MRVWVYACMCMCAMSCVFHYFFYSSNICECTVFYCLVNLSLRVFLCKPQLAYTELFFVDKYWPQLTQMDVRLIMHQYSNRNRRFGV